MAVIPGLILTRTPVVAQNGLECIENPWKGQTLGMILFWADMVHGSHDESTTVWNGSGQLRAWSV